MIALEGGDSGVEADRSTITRDNRRISVQMQQQADRTFTEKGLTSVQAHLLLYILKHSEKGISLTEIHREFGYSMAALSSLVKRLREKGYVRTVPCAGDDRRKILYGTEKGEEVWEFLDRSFFGTQDQLYQGFSQEELATLDRLQKKMLRNLAELTQHNSKEESKP